MLARRTDRATREERLILLGVAIVAAMVWAPIIAVLVGAR